MTTPPPKKDDHTCPICDAPAPQTVKTFPFCTDRCRTLDLGKWIKGEYVISRPMEEADWDED